MLASKAAALLLASLVLLPHPAAAAVITVTTAADDSTPNDGSVSLREAIQAINAGNNLGDPDIIAQNPGVFGVNDTILFSISFSSTVQTIAVGGTGNGALPAITRPVTVNGYSEFGASANTLANGDNAVILVQLNGANAGPFADGLLVGATASGSTISGLVINRFSLNGIELQSGGNQIVGNFVGLNHQGTVAEPNQGDGIRISNASSNTIGGSTPALRNVVSGNNLDGIHIVGSTASPATGNLIQGNFVGVNSAGTGFVDFRPDIASPTAAGNFLHGIEISGGNANTVGGNTAGARNVVGFNLDGIALDNGAQNNVIQGNFLGVGADGVTAVGQVFHGIVVRSSDNLSPPFGPGQANEPATAGNIIGLNPNTLTGLGNLIEFNATAGVAIFGNPLPNNASPAQNSGNSILANSIFQNGTSNPAGLVGIDLSNTFVYPKDDGVTPNDTEHGLARDPNNFQNFPVLDSAWVSGGVTAVVGTLTQAASHNVTEFFSSTGCSPTGFGQGQTFIGAANATTNGSGIASISATMAMVPAGSFITATATNFTADPSTPGGSVNLFNTSEFSACINTGAAEFSGDFDGDGKADLTVYRPNTGQWFVLKSSSGYAASSVYQWGVNGDVPVPGDYDGDGKADPAIYRPSTGDWFILLSGTNYTMYATHRWGVSTDFPVPGDYDGDRKIDPAIYRPSTGQWFVLTSSTNYASSVYYWGATGDIPVPGDYDGDGKFDPAVYRPSTSTWFFLKSSTNYTAGSSYQWGAAGDIPVPRDYDGDGKVDPAIYRSSTGTWFFLKSSTHYTAWGTYQWGMAGDVPVPGDYDGDGRADLVVYRPSANLWYILYSSTNYGTSSVYQWGAGGDLP
jgi:CSLREA domain-containing protein